MKQVLGDGLPARPWLRLKDDVKERPYSTPGKDMSDIYPSRSEMKEAVKLVI